MVIGKFLQHYLVYIFLPPFAKNGFYSVTFEMY